MTPLLRSLRPLCVPVLILACLAVGGAGSVLATCGPFTDTANDAFCPAVLELFTLGITTGTTATTYSPADNVNRLQMAAFLSRTVDGVVRRTSRRTISGRFWTPNDAAAMTTLSGANPIGVNSDGSDLWTGNSGNHTVSRVRASDGKLLETWTGALFGWAVILARGRVYVTGAGGALYQIDPTQTAGSVTTVSTALGNFTYAIAFDGSRFWTANNSGSVSIVTPGPSVPWTVTTVTTGFSAPRGLVYEGSNIWVTQDNGRVLKLDSNGAILQTVTFTGVGGGGGPTFDGTNLWVPLGADALGVLRPGSGAVLAVLTGNGLNGPEASAFDGERVLVTNVSGNSVSLWKAADLSPAGSFPIGSQPRGACSDGLNFWVSLYGFVSPPGGLAKF